MCDYSLAHLTSRPAKVEDVLTTSGFFSTISRGFSPVGETEVAACVLPGTELAFAEPVKHYESDRSGPATDSGQTLARFRQINTDNAFTHHDALELADGQIVLLNNLVEGQSATVLQLPAAPKTAEEAKEQERIAVQA